MNLKYAAIVSIPVVLAAATLQTGAEASARVPVRYVIDTSHSYIGFNARHFGVANVKGNFDRFSGHIMFDEQDVTNSSVEVTIEAASVDTDNERRDNDLRGTGFFAADSFPQITFVSKRVEHAAGGFAVTGDLTMRGVTREVRIPFELAGPVSTGNGQKRLGVEGSLRINRFDYGLNWNNVVENIGVVADTVRIELQIEARGS